MRGESRLLSNRNGFFDECIRKYGDSSVWKCFNELFAFFNLSALVEEEVFVVHAGLSPSIQSIDQVRELERSVDVGNISLLSCVGRSFTEHEGPITDLLWSDPDDREGWGVSSRGAGYTFGEDISEKFNKDNCLSLITRAHQLAMEVVDVCGLNRRVTTGATTKT